MRRYRYYLPFVMFIFLFLVGLVFSPFSEDALATWSMILLAAAWLLDRLAVWYARRKRVGIRAEETSLGTVIFFYNNPWVRGWTRIRALLNVILLLHMAGMGTATVFCGQVIHHMIFGK